MIETPISSPFSIGGSIASKSKIGSTDSVDVSGTHKSHNLNISPSTSAFYEVLYSGKIKVQYKGIPPEFIDDAVENLRKTESKKIVESDPTRIKHNSYENETPKLEKRNSTIDHPLMTTDDEAFRSRAASTSAISKLNSSKKDMSNKTMLLLLGRSDIRLISPDRRQVLLHKNFRDVAHCCQGETYPDRFGFVCRDSSNARYIVYIFQCQSSSVVDEIMSAIKSAFRTAHEKFLKERNKLCSSCPMKWFKHLCKELEGATTMRALSIVHKRLEQLPQVDQDVIAAKFKGAETSTMSEQNEILMMLLRAHCEVKQQSHEHDRTEEGVVKNDFFNDVSVGFLKAKKSLTNSFTDIMKRKASVDLSDWQPTLKTSAEDSPTRPRSQTVGSIGSLLLSKEKASKLYLFKRSNNNISPVSKTSPVAINPRARRDIFQRVTTPVKKKKEPSIPENRNYKELWVRAIKQQILIIRMEKENKKIIASQEEAEERRLKISYESVGIDSQGDSWETFLEENKGKSLDRQTLLHRIKKGIPKSKRGDIWKFIVNQWELLNPKRRDDLPEKYNVPYSELKSELTPYQHTILIDLGRTFPNYPYFSTTLGPGQLSLYNVLKAYSLLDIEVGYCQGLSFVAAVLLMHSECEEDAFSLLKHLMYGLNMREQYKTDMQGLQVQMYQLSRLVHDVQKDVFDVLEEMEVHPSLYATPWFLTLFSSHFPLGFVVRVFDLTMLEGPEALFKLSLALLFTAKTSILNCNGLDDLMILLKQDLPKMTSNHILSDVLEQAFGLSICKQLDTYEVEYHVLQEELSTEESPLQNQNSVLREKLLKSEEKVLSLENELNKITSDHSSQILKSVKTKLDSYSEETFTKDKIEQLLQEVLESTPY